MKKPLVALTMGDPAGIGPEICLKASLSEKIRKICVPIIVGDFKIIKKASNLLNCKVKLRKIKEDEIKNIKETESILIYDISSKYSKNFKFSHPSADSGKASLLAIEKAVFLYKKGLTEIIVTAPINKYSIKLAGSKFPGHTEMLAHLTNTKKFAMMLIGGKIKVILVTIHIPLKEVSKSISKEKILEKIELANLGGKLLGIKNPKIAVCGLNPHAGDSGVIGDEEIKIITPACEIAKKRKINVFGPFPADTLFYKVNKGEYDIVVSMYHDQGLIPLKMLYFEKGVNATIGLPLIRTSPDHGTAYDIAWRGIANPSSIEEAIKIAIKMWKNKVKLK